MNQVPVRWSAAQAAGAALVAIITAPLAPRLPFSDADSAYALPKMPCGLAPSASDHMQGMCRERSVA